MQINKLLLIIPLLLFTNLLIGQNGFIRGSVFDGKTGESLPGVNISVEGTGNGTTTDLDGKFNFGVVPGTYRLRISYISYETISISDVVVKANEAALFENLKLNEVAVQLGETVITAAAIRNTESALLTMKQKSANVIDGISSSALKRTGDSDAASSMKRITGVSVEGGKYVFVRGLGDRYTKTILNGLDIPGLDPDRNTLQMDIFPTGIIDNLVVNKSFSADLPADFTGGVININIKAFPETKQANISLGLGYNKNSHFNPDFLTYKGGKTDWLGFDDGMRKIPTTNDIPLFSEVVGSPNGERGLRYREILRSFNPTLAASKQTSFMDYSFGASFGNQFQVGKYTMGYIFSVSYKSSSDFFKNAEYGRYGMSSDADITELEVREKQEGDYGVKNLLLSGLAGFAIKSQKSKYRINLLHLQSGESQAGIFDYTNSDQGAEFSGFQHNLEYSQRALSNLLIDGKHNLVSSGWDFEWKISPTISTIKDPDIRYTRYEDRSGNYSIGTEVGFPERIWRDLDEISLAGVLHITKDFKFLQENAKLKFGGAYTYKDRDFVIQNFAINIRNIPLTGDPNEIFREDNLWPYNGSISRGTAYEVPFIPVNPNQYNANLNNIAGYVSFDFNPLKKLKAIAGVRVEKYEMYYTGQDQLGTKVLDNENVLDNFNFFPTLNLIYKLNESQNLRLSFSKTIARPSFKELSYAEIFDPISGRTFIGGLFRDANDVSGIEYWDGNLTSTDILNYDFRWEIFQKNGQTISASLFYKLFDRPIEMVQYATQSGSYQPRNVGDGQIIGAEIELRQNLHLFGEAFRNFSLNMNFTYTKSKIELSSTEYTSRVYHARTGQKIEKYRDMAGQAPFIINAGFAYSGGENGFWKSLEAGLYYNVQGETIQYVGIADRPDIYLVPFHSLNFNANKNFGKNQHFQISLKIENLLNNIKESVYKSFNAADQFYSRIDPGTIYQVKLSYSF
ncbi:MAG: TonB-dependent receptor [Bacteroidetes bacterium]|nr:TonB-dependent receptor [Bacteroidota bacterium]